MQAHDSPRTDDMKSFRGLERALRREELDGSSPGRLQGGQAAQKKKGREGARVGIVNHNRHTVQRHKERSRTKQTRGMLRLKNNLLRPWKSQAPGEPGPMAFRTEHWLTNSQINSSHPGSHLWGAPECNPIDPN